MGQADGMGNFYRRRPIWSLIIAIAVAIVLWCQAASMAVYLWRETNLTV